MHLKFWYDRFDIYSVWYLVYFDEVISLLAILNKVISLQ
jgi:hypothetical protein